MSNHEFFITSEAEVYEIRSNFIVKIIIYLEIF